MYKFSDDNQNNDISLHDCRSSKLLIEGNKLTFVFDEGFFVSENNAQNLIGTPAYTDRSEVVFETPSDDPEDDVTVYLFSDTGEEGRSIREEIPLAKLAELLERGMELEFLYKYEGYSSFIFDCWLWFDTEPYHRECELRIPAESVSYRWNELFAE